ncbi:acyl-CoA reductase [Fibrella sp. HMF5335]|uniref:Acyl-CoA reductase n=1 Tax=Fibrella rubiginis TaxID=2817060 RepID=A0A939K4Z2_9BACT|nr:acyl-CoA reductase [Fibrella rubiginis]MBO0935905.1 acyl-CoA reductase [Fibrella rubiginis]
MFRQQRLHAFIQLGERLRDPTRLAEREEAAYRANSKNNWFTVPNCLLALDAIASQMLAAEALTDWLAQYPAEPETPRKVGVVMAGNIPAVGFSDLLCVLISGHSIMAKLSSQDEMLMRYLIQQLITVEPAFADRIEIVDRLNAADAFIATGSDNTARYFEYYFAKKPHVIRKNRTSVGVLTGVEDDAQLERLGDDILTYYGLGCRNVSTLFVPDELDGKPFDFVPLLRTLEPRMNQYLNLHKYQNNYDYNKSIYLVNRVEHLDNGFLMVTPTPDSTPGNLVSPISVVYYQTYASLDHLRDLLAQHAEKIQVVVSAAGWYPGSIPFGTTQRPGLNDYADGVDTMAFLQQL